MEERKRMLSTLGLDVGDTWTHWAVMGRDGLGREGRVKTTAPELQKVFQRSGASAVVLEAGSQSPWIDRLGRAAGFEVTVVNPNRLQAVSASVRKTDRNDARLLAELGHSGLLLWEVHHRGESAQRGLQLLTSRDKLVTCRTKLVNQVRGHAKSLGTPLASCDADQFHRLSGSVGEMEDAEPLFLVIGQLTSAIKDYEVRIRQLAKEHPVAQRLMTVPGVGPLTALAFVYVVDDPARFPKSRQVGPYLGLTPRIDSSGQSNKELRITKAGNGFMRRLLVSSAQTLLRLESKPSALRDWGVALVDRGGRSAKKKAAVAVARKLAVNMHKIWVSGETWTPYPEQDQA